VAYAENVHGGAFIQWHIVVICIWCALFVTSYSCFQAKFLDKTAIFFHSHAHYFCKKTSAMHSPYNKGFVKYRAQGGVTPNPPPCVRPWLLDFKKRRPRFAEKHMKTLFGGHTKKVVMIFVKKVCRKKLHKTLRGSLGKFGQKSFATPKMCLLLNL